MRDMLHAAIQQTVSQHVCMHVALRHRRTHPRVWEHGCTGAARECARRQGLLRGLDAALRGVQ
jgi:hypothetical protein